MPFQLVFLWTDVLVYALIATAAGFGWYASRHEHLRAPWRQVARRPLAMGALVVLAAYVAIGLLDSVHFRERLPDREERYSFEVKSVLDVVLEPLRSRTERTYSAPFAAQAYTKETVERADGTTARIYPRLTHGGAHLDDPADRGADILARTAMGLVSGLVVWAILVGAFVAAYRGGGEPYAVALRRLARGGTSVPWRTILGALGVLVLLAAVLVRLAPYYHVFGTDQVGIDVFYRSLKSVRTGLVIGTLTTLVMLPFALLLGVMAGYLRGWVDDIIQYVYTTLSSIPGVLLIAAAILSLQVYMANHPESFATVVERADARLLFLCIILGITSWTSLCRLLRGETLKLREIDYVEAARALGVGRLQIMTRHLFPNVMHIVLITVVLDFSGLVLAEAVLSYVGVGVDPSMDSWGNMINSARLEMAREPMVWWSLAAAFISMFGLVLAANLFSDAVRDAFDPRLRR
ncbi:peptide ABC transporter permease [Sulfurifustis variabilis]|uniref:Peptide ABC transporter permease n=1 Tax=Sulfurifustis variabilis TaxID=1675686 RepID=A0A1B4V2W4_9GAMM|nr:ABC transporter permease [Sulfurifustis variabilis]BAU47883.1 peptide ABC transporter permease [Sulfurifustis variabilis]